MKRNALEDLESILEMRFKDRQRSFAQVVAAENALRADLSKLDEMAANAAQSEYQSMRAIGSDVIWKAWLGRTKTSLNMELAQVLAQKDRMIRRVRKDYGKLLASQKLLRQQRARHIQDADTKELSDVIHQHLFKQLLDKR